MTRAKNEIEMELDSFREQLMEYERLVTKKLEVTAQLASIDKQLNDLRAGMMSSKGQDATTNYRVRSRPTAAISLPTKTRKHRIPTDDKIDTVLEKQDKRVQKSLGALIKALNKHGGEANIEQLAKAVGISRKAVWLRIRRGKKLGLIKQISKGLYGARQ
jgi:hypothetical protein